LIVHLVSDTTNVAGYRFEERGRIQIWRTSW